MSMPRCAVLLIAHLFAAMGGPVKAEVLCGKEWVSFEPLDAEP